MNIDILSLHADLRALEQRIRELKALLHQPWTRPMADEQQQALQLAAEVTPLYTLRAWARGRLHCTTPPRALRDSARDLAQPLRWDAREHNRTIAERIASRYRIADADADAKEVAVTSLAG